MKSFKEFLSNTPVVKNKQGVPTAIVDFGKRGGKPLKNVSRLPSAIIDFPRKKPKINENGYDDSQWIEHHDENKHIGGTHREQSANLHASQSNNELGKHLAAYSRWSSDVNKSLLSAHQKGREHPNTFTDDLHSYHLPTLDKELDEHKLTHPLNVYSGVGFNPQHLAAEHPEGHIHLPAYTSTSIDKDIAREFASSALKPSEGKHIIHMQLPKGHAGKYIGKNSENSHESEFVVPRNTTIKVHPNPQEIVRLGQKYQVHKATIVPKEDKE